jgi:oxalate decarboxylase/phosphoglucose isomerase-like protein (cupin superfamily)
VKPADPVQNEREVGWKPMLHAPRDQGAICTLVSTQLSGATSIGAGLARLEPGEYHLKHHHPGGEEFYIITHGTGEMFLDGRTVPATPGTGIFIPVNGVHAIRNTGEEVLEFVWGISTAAYAEMGFEFDE